MLALGTALAGLGYCFAGASTGFAMLLGALFIGGIGASTQHPIASALVARAFAGPRSLKALGTYNFAGDIGKMTLPATLSLMLLADGLASGARDSGLSRRRAGGGDLFRHAALRTRALPAEAPADAKAASSRKPQPFGVPVAA